MSTPSWKICVLGLAAGLGLMAGGCSTRAVGSRAARAELAEPAAVTARDSGPSWDAVMPGDYLVTDAGDAELSRRDEALNLRTTGPLLASTQWPHAPQPSFERPWRVHLPRQPESVLQFLPPRTAR